MQRKIATLIIGLMVASGSALAACSSGDPIPDEDPGDTPQYQSAEDEPGNDSMEGFYQGEDPSGPDPSLSPASVPQAMGPVATINGEEIGAEEFNEQIELIQAQNPHIPPEMLAEATDDIVEGLVQQRLVEDALDEADVEVSEEVVDERVAQVREEFQAFLGPDMDFDEYLAAQGLSPEEFRDEVRDMIALEELLVESGVEMPTEEELQAFYDDHPEFFTQPESVEARHIVIAAETATEEGFEAAEARAEEVYEQLTEEDADFEAIAAEHSDAPSAQMGGNLGRVSRFEVPPEFEATAFDLEAGEISEPVRTADGYEIIQVLEHFEEETQEFAEVRDQIESQLRNEALQEAIPQFLADLRDDAAVEIHRENIE